MKTFNEYQEKATSTAIYPNKGNNIIYPALGLCGEAGEIAEKVKKMIRDDGGMMTDERHAAIVKEIGDVMWYVAAVCSELNVTMESVAQGNIEKLFSRRDRGTLKGDGDNR